MTLIPTVTRLNVIAAATHMANRAYCIALGDHSQPVWEQAPDWQKSSAINGVEGALAGATPEQSHESWLKEKEATGWKYGPVKDPDKKEHPCFVPYSQLPPAQRKKDDIFVATARTLAAVLGTWLFFVMISTAAFAVDCPPGAKSCKFFVVTPEQEETLKALITQTCYTAPYLQVKSAVEFYTSALEKAPAGEPAK